MGFKLIYITFLVSLYSCKNPRTPIERINEELSLIKNSSLVRVVPDRLNDSSLLLNLFRKRRSTLGLASVENGIDGFQINIWEDFDKVKGMVIILDYANNKWNAKGCTYKYHATVEDSWLDSLAGKIISLGEPKSGWNVFLNKVLDYGVLDLRDYESIPDYFTPTDLKDITVEISGKRYYRVYELPGAYLQNKSIKDAKKIIEILKLVKKNFPRLTEDRGD